MMMMMMRGGIRSLCSGRRFDLFRTSSDPATHPCLFAFVVCVRIEGRKSAGSC